MGCQYLIGEILYFGRTFLGIEYSIEIDFPKLYDCCNDNMCLASDCWGNGNWNIYFKRAFGLSEMQVCERARLMQILDQFHLGYWGRRRQNVLVTREVWGLHNQINVQKAQIFLWDGVNKRMEKLWGFSFAALYVHDKLHTSVNLIKKKWKGDKKKLYSMLYSANWQGLLDLF